MAEKKPYTTEIYHGMTFQQIAFKMASNGLLWNLVLIALAVTDGWIGTWTWVNWFFVIFFTLRFFSSAYIAGWVSNQRADRHIVKESYRA